MMVLGIDPGQTGGLALVDSRGPRVWAAGMMPLIEVRTKKALDACKLVTWLRAHPKPDVGVIELVHAMPRQGVSSSFQFGRMFGAAEAVGLIWCNRWEHVIPRVWKEKMGLSDAKTASVDLANRIFGKEAWRHWPLKKHEGVAEAALIAAYWIRHVSK